MFPANLPLIGRSGVGASVYIMRLLSTIPPTRFPMNTNPHRNDSYRFPPVPPIMKTGSGVVHESGNRWCREPVLGATWARYLRGPAPLGSGLRRKDGR